jgi:hypothetical protein
VGGEVIEGVAIFIPGWKIGKAETRQIGCYYMIVGTQDRDEVPEHKGGCRIAMHQKDDWRIGGSGFSVKNIQPIDFGCMIMYRNAGVQKIFHGLFN